MQIGLYFEEYIITGIRNKIQVYIRIARKEYISSNSE